MKTVAALILSAALLSVVTSGTVKAQTKTTETVTVPAFTSLTGPVAILGQDAKKGIEIAVQQINETGGIGGRKLTVEISDSQGKPDVARREMERMVRLQNAPLVYGCDISAATSTAAQFAEASQTPLFNAGAVSSEILDRHYHYYFTQQITGNNEAETVLSFLESLTKTKGGLKGQKIALLYEDSPRGAGTGHEVRKLLEKEGIKPIVDVSYNRADRNLLPVIKKVQEAAPNILVWAGYTEDFVAGIKAMLQLDFTPYVLGVGGGAGDPRLPQLVDVNFITRLHLSNVDYFSADLKRASYLTEQYRKKYNALPSSYVGMCYSGVMTLRSVLEAAFKKSPNPTRSDFQAAFRELNLNEDQTTIPGSIRFDADGRNVGAHALVAQWKDNATKKATIFPPQIATASPEPLK